jgi:hypothetical protein
MEYNLFLPWYKWKITHLALNNNQSITHSYFSLIFYTALRYFINLCQCLKYFKLLLENSRIKNGINPNSNEFITCMNSSIIIIYYDSIVLWYLVLPISKRTKSEAWYFQLLGKKDALTPYVAYCVVGCFLNL